MKKIASIVSGLICCAAAASFAEGAGEGAAAAREEVYGYLKECPAFFLATVDAEGGGAAVPRVRPFGALALWDGAIYIQTGNFKPVYRQMSANPRVEICALKPDRGGWIRIEATVVEDTRREARKAVLDANPGLRGMYDEDDGKTAVFRLEKATATLNSFGSPARTLEF
ncbi:MAG: pyridoxamine 5'-phosphate oxidase family protein [Kiritimatiellae bacterium]|nr:pyridoxamine 5'-phosphate oxidase family protein [Kiritimatiellia bacterium]